MVPFMKSDVLPGNGDNYADGVSNYHKYIKSGCELYVYL